MDEHRSLKAAAQRRRSLRDQTLPRHLRRLWQLHECEDGRRNVSEPATAAQFRLAGNEALSHHKNFDGIQRMRRMRP